MKRSEYIEALNVAAVTFVDHQMSLDDGFVQQMTRCFFLLLLFNGSLFR